MILKSLFQGFVKNLDLLQVDWGSKTEMSP